MSGRFFAYHNTVEFSIKIKLVLRIFAAYYFQFIPRFPRQQRELFIKINQNFNKREYQ